MPLNGGGTASRVPGTSAAPNTTIKSADYEASMDDIYSIFNTARPVAYGGTGASTVQGAVDNLFDGTAVVDDGDLRISDPSDRTKIGRFDVGAVTAGQTRVWSMPDRDLVINPIWEEAGVIDLTGLSYAAFTDLSPYRMLRLRVDGTPASGTGEAFLRVSQDNGSTWVSGSSDYSYGSIIAAGSTVAAAPVNSAHYMGLTETLDPNIMIARCEVTNFNVALASLFLADSIYSTGSTYKRLLPFGYRSASFAQNALLFGTANGLAFTSGIAVLEGVRG